MTFVTFGTAVGVEEGYTPPTPSGSGKYYYVSPDNGSDSNDGLSAANAFLSLTKAIGTAVTPGDVVILRPGTYTAGSTSPFAQLFNSGSVGFPISFVSEEEGGAIVDGDTLCAVGFLLDDKRYIDFYGIQFENFTECAIKCAGTGTDQAKEIGFYHCVFTGNARETRKSTDSNRYGAVLLNENTIGFTFSKCLFTKNGPLPNGDFDDESSATNTTYRNGFGIRLSGCKHVIDGCKFGSHDSGYPVSVGGHWDHTTLASGEFNVTITDSYFFASNNDTPYSDVHGVIEVYDDQTTHGTYNDVEPKLKVDGCTFEESLVGTGTDTAIGIYNDAKSYGTQTIAHEFTNNTVTAATTYNEDQAWVTANSNIVASGNTVDATLSDDVQKTAKAEATKKILLDRRVEGLALFSPYHIAEDEQYGWWDASDESTFDKDGSEKVENWYNKFLATLTMTQATSADRPTWNSAGYVEFVDTSDDLETFDMETTLLEGNLTVLMVCSFASATPSYDYLLQFYPAASPYTMAGLGANSYTEFYAGTHNGGVTGSNQATFDIATYGYTANQKFMMGLKQTVGTTGGDLVSLFLNGEFKDSNTANHDTVGLDRMYFNLTGDAGNRIYEVLIFRSDDDYTRQLCEGYLAQKHDLTLPASHRFASRPPMVHERVAEEAADPPAPPVTSQIEYYGPAVCQYTLGNTRMEVNEVCFRFEAEKTGDLIQIRPYWKEDNRDPGYSKGTGGSYQVQLVADDGTSAHEPDTSNVLATSSTYTPGLTPGTGPKGGVSWTALTFSTKPTLTKGTIYHLIWKSLDASPSSNYVSINQTRIETRSPLQATVEPTRTTNQWAAMYRARGSSGSWSIRGGYSPIIEIGIDTTQSVGTVNDGFGNGTINVFYRNRTGDSLVSGVNRLRQRMTPDTTMTLQKVAVCAGLYSGSGDLTLEIQNSSRTALETVTIPASSFPSVSSSDGAGHLWAEASLAGTTTLSASTLYFLELRCASGTEYELGFQRDGGLVGHGFVYSRWRGGYAQYSDDSGSSWQGPRYWSVSDRQDTVLPFYFEVTV